MNDANVFLTGDSLPPAGSPEAGLLLGALLDEHSIRAAERALAALGGPLNTENLDRYLHHEACVRHPTEIIFTSDGLEPHQFGEAVLREIGGKTRCELRIHPRFAARLECLPLFTAYLTPVINYGPVASSDLCEWYGARLTGMDPDDYYATLCRIMDDDPAPPTRHTPPRHDFQTGK